MLTETQYKALMILFDDEGHAGWQLAEALRMEESNLNPLLKKLEKKNFIFQGQPRKSNRPKQSKKYKESKKLNMIKESEGPKKRDGDYKEFPYYISRDLKIFDSLIRDLAVTDRFYDIGFPFRFVRASSYMRSMRDTFKEDFNKCLADLFRESDIIARNCCVPDGEPTRVDIDSMNFEKFHILSFKEEMPPIIERPVSEELLGEIEIWWLKYELCRCLREDPVNLDEVFKWKAVMPDKYILGYDIIKAIRDAINMQPNYMEGKALDYFMSTSF